MAFRAQLTAVQGHAGRELSASLPVAQMAWLAPAALRVLER